MKVHLVDGTYELFRTFFAAPSRRSPEGAEVGAVRILVLSLLSLLRQEDVSHVACAFDSVIESFRNDLFDGYKSGDGIDPELFGQFPLAERATRALGVVVWPMIEFEADDALATGAARWGNAEGVEQVVLCSPDKDLTQCVQGSRVVTLDRRREKVLDEAGVAEKFGVAPASIPDWLALVGDAADGIPGLPRWGAKSTARVLATYGHLEQIPLGEPWQMKVRGADGLQATLRERWDDALLYRRLAILRTDVPLPEDLPQLRWRGARRDEMEQLAVELGDPRLPERVHRWQDP